MKHRLKMHTFEKIYSNLTFEVDGDGGGESTIIIKTKHSFKSLDGGEGVMPIEYSKVMTMVNNNPS